MSKLSQARLGVLLSIAITLVAGGCSSVGSTSSKVDALTQNVLPPAIPSPSPTAIDHGVSSKSVPAVAAPGDLGARLNPASPAPAVQESFLRIPDDASIDWYTQYFQNSVHRQFRVWLERSGRYVPYMKAIFREEGLPEDLVYLSLIESGFSPRAYSSSRAAGLWQFMSGTGKKYDLVVNGWIDQRRDPMMSTRAAARYLKDLYNEFHSWSLAMAAYNAGEGKIANAVADTGTENYWEIRNTRALSNETKDYVPKFIAAMRIAKDPARYGFTDIEYEDPLNLDTVKLKRPTEVKVLARAAGVSFSEFKMMNPALTRWSTPPYMHNVPINVPKGEGDQFLASVESLPSSRRHVEYADSRTGGHVIHSGESLWTIAHHYGVSVSSLMAANDLHSHSVLRVGQRLAIPGGGYGNVIASSRSERGSSNWLPHRIRRGESLFAIAHRFGTSIGVIRHKNHLVHSSLLREGETIMVPAR